MSSLKKFGPLVLVICAFGAISSANASAFSEFTASKTGEISGWAEGAQKFTFNGGTVSCNAASPSGKINSTASTELHITVQYKSCTAFGIASVHVSPITYRLTANGWVHIENTMTVTVTKTLFTGHCTVSVGPQLASSARYSTFGTEMFTTLEFSSLSYTSTGGICGSSGTGTFFGEGRLWEVGGTLNYDF